MYKGLEEGIKKALAELGFPEVAFSLEHPKDMSHGDYMTNVSLLAGKQTNQNPVELASTFCNLLKEQNIVGVKTIEVAGPGFINFMLDRSYFVKKIDEVLKTETFGHTDNYSDQTILVEHSSPNLFKPFHIGHLMNNTVGEAITRLAHYSDAQVQTMSFPSDISLGVAKAVFVLLERYGPEFEPTDVSVLGDAYVEGVRRYEEAESTQPCGSMVYRVKEIADNLYAANPSPEWTLFQKCKTFNINYFETIVASLGSHFDSYIYESEAGIVGKKIVEDNTSGVFTESDGAVVYIPKEETKLHTSVFLNSQGNPTYEAKDLGLLELKFTRHNPDLSIFITDSQQVSHFNVVLDAAYTINQQWADNSRHIFHGRMTFKGQKMSSRLGGVPLVEDVIATVIEEVKEKNPDIDQETARQVGIGAIKFAILKAKTGMNIDFDPETSLSFIGDSGPYLQYTAVRAGSLLQKGVDAGIVLDTVALVPGTEILERYIARFPEVILRAQTEWAPHYVVTYLTELAQYFNSWYGQGKIIDDNHDLSAYRLGIVAAVRRVLMNGLWVLGISVPEKM